MPLSGIRVFIVEDQPNIRNDIHSILEHQEGFVVVGSCGTVKDAKKLIKDVKPDLLLLDIYLPDGTGFEVLEGMPKEYKVIFITAFENHAIKAIKFGALDYLLKPIDDVELLQALNKVSKHFPTKVEQLHVASKFHLEGIRNKLVLRSQDYLQVIEIDQITYCQSHLGYTTFHLSDGKKIVVSKILKDYEDVLTEPVFLRPHQSYMVNINYVDRYTKDGFIHLRSGDQIPVATRRKEAILEFFNRL